MKTRAEEISEAYKRGVQAERKATLHIMAAIGTEDGERDLLALRDALLKKGIWPSNEETALHAEIDRLERDLADASVKCARMATEISELKTEILRLTLLSPPSEK